MTYDTFASVNDFAMYVPSRMAPLEIIEYSGHEPNTYSSDRIISFQELLTLIHTGCLVFYGTSIDGRLYVQR